jgi:hypothetical protein
MITKKEAVTIENLNNGEVAARLELLIEEALANCLDLNYDSSARKVQIVMEFIPNERRDEVICKPKFKCDKGRIIMKPIALAVGLNSGGRVEAREFITRQQEIFNQGVTPIRPEVSAGIQD